MLAHLRAQGAQIIVFNYHWGEERQYKSNATQRAIAHYCIDSGADLVIGHRPHVVQAVETYRGKQNCLFPGQPKLRRKPRSDG